jgi:nucleoid-associated protein EbfC
VYSSIAVKAAGQVGTFAVRSEIPPAIGFRQEREDAGRDENAVSTPSPGPSGISAMPEMPRLPDVAELMEQVRQQKEEVERIQRGVEAMEVTGGSRHDEVQVTVRGSGQVTSVSIDPDALREHDADELGDFVREAFNDALRRVAEASSARFRPFIEAASRAGEF